MLRNALTVIVVATTAGSVVIAWPVTHTGAILFAIWGIIGVACLLWIEPDRRTDSTSTPAPETARSTSAPDVPAVRSAERDS